MLVADLHHFLGLPEDVPDPALRLAERLAGIVRAATAGDAGSALPCPRRPRHRACPPDHRPSARTPPGPIGWRYSVCADQGVISNWENTSYDLRRRQLGIAGAVHQVIVPRTRSWKINYVQRRDRGAVQPWDTEAAIQAGSDPRVDVLDLGLGDQLAVVLSTTLDATSDVSTYLRQTATPIKTLLSITPRTMPHDASITGSGHAARYVQQVRQIVRQHLTTAPTTAVIHLFLAGPGGLALLLGHRWNRLRPTIVYEHLGAGLGYTPAFSID